MHKQWWHGDFEYKDHLILQLIPFLLSRSLDDKATKIDISRTYKILLAFDLLDFEDDTITYFKSLCCGTLKSPAYLHNSASENLITYLFQLNKLNNTIKVHILSVKKSHLKLHGSMYLKA